MAKRFGSDDIFNLILENVDNKNYSGWYADVCESVAMEARLVLRKSGLSKQDIEDLTQEVQIEVVQHLSEFVEKSKTYTPAQRSGWVGRITQNTLIDYLRKYPQKRESSIDGDVLPEQADNTNLSTQVICRVELFEAIRQIGSINTTPDKAMAFLLNRLDTASSGKSGLPSLIAEKFTGKTLGTMFDEIEELLATLLGSPAPENVLAPLWRKVEPISGELFCMTPRRITDSSNWISTKIRQSREGGETDV